MLLWKRGGRGVVRREWNVREKTLVPALPMGGVQRTLMVEDLSWGWRIEPEVSCVKVGGCVHQA